MSRPRWSEEEDSILALPVSAEEAAEALVRAGYRKRSAQAIYNRRALIDPYPEHRRALKAVLRLARRTRDGSTWRSSNPAEGVLWAVEKGYARLQGKSTYRITLGGIAWLTERLGPGWDQMKREGSKA